MVKPFTNLAVTEPCPATDEMLLALAAEFWPIDYELAQARLDEAARPLFGYASSPPAAAAQKLSDVLEDMLAVETSRGPELSLLRLDQGLRHHVAHPMIIAALSVELLRRAGIPATVCSSPGRWYAGIRGTDRMVLIDIELSSGLDAAPDQVRRHCSHELAFCALTGISNRFDRLGEKGAAQRACALRNLLPVDPDPRDKANPQTTLDAAAQDLRRSPRDPER